MALLGVVLGSMLQLQQPDLWPPLIYGILAAAALVAMLAVAIKNIANPLFALLLAGVLGFATVGLRAQHFAAGSLSPALEGRDLVLTGVVATMPQPTEAGTRFRMRVESAQLDGADVDVPRQVQLGWYHGPAAGAGGILELQRSAPALEPGERWRLQARLKAPHGHLNPRGFDYELWLWEQGVQATGYVRAGPSDAAPQRLARTWLHPLERWRHQVRERIFRRVEDRRSAGVLAALVVGDQGAIERADWDVFRATGVAHLMSISGLHVTMFAWAAAAVVGALWRRSSRLCLAFPAQHAALLGGVALASCYALFSGWGVPSQRTVWMLATVALLRLAGHRWPWPWVWLLACAVVTVFDPWALTQPGFWLSFVAVGVLFATDAGMQPAQAGWLRRGLALLREQWIVTLALTPLSLLLFAQVSLVGLGANLLAIPWVTVVVTPLALGGVAVAPLWDLAAAAVRLLAWGLEWMAAVPLATLSLPSAPLWAAVLGVAGGLLLAMRLPASVRLLGLPMLVPVLLWQPVRPAAGEFELLAADVGQGNAVIVRTASSALVYDAGPRYSTESDAGHRVLVPLLRQMGERVDRLVLSHRDSDHTGGAAALLAMQPGAALLSSLEDGHALLSLRRSTRCEAGQRWEWDGVHFAVLHPRRQDYLNPPKPNAISCVLHISNAHASVLLAGDIEQAQEARLAGESAQALRADVLLVPHHGSKTSSSAPFLDAVQPRFALVQAGYRNRFGHPAEPVLRRLRERDIAVVESARCGAAHWRSSEAAQVQCERQVARRYWNHRLP